MKQTFLLLTLLPAICFGQLPYTENLYETRVESDIAYGEVINYAGQSESLELDIYKPIGDSNCTRPCLVLVHGGAWIAGSKDDLNIANIAQHYAEKGWVVATINYRLGTHKIPSYDMYLFCNEDISAPCGYVADSAEVIRANYRGQQDAKGAIRFMKNRSGLDSIDVNNVFIAGESAGGFVSYAATFMQTNSEKPSFCGAIANAPTPDADLLDCLPVGFSLTRPDLGDVQGDLNLGTHDASVQGIGNIYGAMFDFDMLADETEWPVLYQFHQGSDVVVNYDYGRVLGRMDWECYTPTNLCQNYARYPRAFGSKGIEAYFASLVDGPERVSEIIENYEYSNDCFDNGHSIDNWVTRSNNMANLFATRIEDNGNTPTTGPCFASLTSEEIGLVAYPNPSTGLITLSPTGNEIMNVTIFSSNGSIVKNFNMNSSTEINLLPGIYLLKISNSANYSVQKLVVL